MQHALLFAFWLFALLKFVFIEDIFRHFGSRSRLSTDIGDSNNEFFLKYLEN
jgi:hypothetical protein